MTERKITKIRIFVSSPSDVRPERQIVGRVIDRLNRQLKYHFYLEPVFWERQPLVATKHFQEGIEPPSTTDIVILLLWERLGTLITDERFRGPVSGRTVTGTEWEFEDAFLASSRTGTPDLLVYRKCSPAQLSVNGEDAVEQRRAVDAFIDRWFIDPETKAFKGAFRNFDTPTGLEAMVETHLRENLLLRLGPDHPIRAVRWHRDSPFLGLRSFDAQDSPIFFGRTEARNQIREALATMHARGKGIVIVLGASGSGKTSVIKAGVLPDILVPGVLPRAGLIRHAVLRPGENVELLDAFAQACAAGSALPNLPADFAERCPTPEAALPAMLDALAAVKSEIGLLDPWEARFVIVIDQLEEIFSSAVPIADREIFIKLLVACSAAPAILVIATLRSDFFPALEAYPELVTATDGEGRYLLRAPSAAELNQIILFPALEAGLTFERDPDTGITLDKVLEADAAQGSGVLALLEFTLDQLWQQRTEFGELTYQAYRRIGGLEGAIGRQAERIYGAQPAAAQAGLPALIFALTGVDQNDPQRVAARLVPREALGLGSPADLLALAFAAPDARLVTGSGDAGLLRFAHEAVLTYWPRAQEELNNIREDLTVRGRLEQAALLWRNAPQRDKTGFLLRRGTQLSAARSLLARRGAELDTLVAAYINASDRNARKIIYQLTATACAVVLLGICAVTYLTEGRIQHEIALKMDSERDALLSRQDAAASNFPGAIAIAVRGLPHNLAHPSRPLVQDDLNALREAMLAFGGNATSTQLIGGDVLNFLTFPDAVLSPDGRYLAISQPSAQSITLWSAKTGQLLGTLPIPAPEDVIFAGQTGMVFSGDGSKLMVALINIGFAVFDTRTLALADRLNMPSGILSLRYLQADQRGDRLLTNGNMGCAVWDFAAGKQVLSCGKAQNENAVLSPDGHYAFSWSDQGNALWDVGSNAQPATLPAGNSLIYAASFSPDSQSVATGTADGSIVITQTASPADSRQAARLQGCIHALISAPNGAALAVVTMGPPQPDLTGAKKNYPLLTFLPQNPHVVFSPDGQNLISPVQEGAPSLLNLRTGAVRQLDPADTATNAGRAIRLIDTQSGAEVTSLNLTTFENKYVFAGSNLIVTVDPTSLRNWRFGPAGNATLQVSLAGNSRGCLGPSGRTILALGEYSAPALIDIASQKVTQLGWTYVANDQDNDVLFAGNADRAPHVIDCDGRDILSGFVPSLPKAAPILVISPFAPLPVPITTAQQNAIAINNTWSMLSSFHGAVLALDPKRKFAFIGDGSDQSLLVNTGTRQAQLLPRDLSMPTFSQNAHYLAVVDGTQAIALYDPATGRFLGHARFGNVTVTALGFDETGDALFVGKTDGSVSRFPLPSGKADLIQGATGQAVDRFQTISDGAVLMFSRSGTIMSIAASGKVNGVIKRVIPGDYTITQGDLLIEYAADQPLTIWDMSKLRRLALIHVPNGGITGADISPDGNALATTDSSGDITIWNLQTGAEEENLPVVRGTIELPQYDASGQNILTLTESNGGLVTAILFHTPSDQALINAALQLTAGHG